VIERPGRCFAFDAMFGSAFALDLSRDGNELYLDEGDGAPDRKWSFVLWRTDTGEHTIEIAVDRPTQFYPLNAVGQVGIAVAGHMDVHDVHTVALQPPAPAP
jgi:hypothetical protein